MATTRSSARRDFPSASPGPSTMPAAPGTATATMP